MLKTVANSQYLTPPSKTGAECKMNDELTSVLLWSSWVALLPSVIFECCLPGLKAIKSLQACQWLCDKHPRRQTWCLTRKGIAFLFLALITTSSKGWGWVGGAKALHWDDHGHGFLLKKFMIFFKRCSLNGIHCLFEKFNSAQFCYDCKT